MSLTEASAIEVAKTASVAARGLATLSNASRNEALTTIHAALSDNKDAVLQANAKDMEIATRAVENGDLSHSVLKRLDLRRPGKYEDMLAGILNVRDLPDPGARKMSPCDCGSIQDNISRPFTKTHLKWARSRCGLS